MQSIECGLALLHTQLLASVAAQRFALLFDMVQVADARQGSSAMGLSLAWCRSKNLRRACAQQPNSTQGIGVP